MFRNWFWGENVLFEGVGYLFVGIRAYRLAGWSLARDGGRGIVGQRHSRLHDTTPCVYTALTPVASGRTLLSSLRCDANSRLSSSGVDCLTSV